jgi:hypothetical protein
MLNQFLICLTLFLLTACSVAPINTTTTARPLGKDNNQVTASGLITGFQYTRGLSEKIDLSVGIENQFGLVFNVFGKYNFKDGGTDGFSIAGISGFGYADGIGKSKSAYAGGVFSYRKDSIEPFLVARLNYVRWKYSSLDSNDRDDLITIPTYKDSFIYSQVDVGGNYITDRAHVGLGVHIFTFPDSSAVTPFIDIGYRF